MNLSMIKMEKNDGVVEFIRECDDQSDVFFCLMYGHKIIEDMPNLTRYFSENIVGLLYYDYVEDEIYHLHNSYSLATVGDFDRNIIVSKKALKSIDLKTIHTFAQLCNSVANAGFISLHIPKILSVK